jgi:hypothetical protein
MTPAAVKRAVAKAGLTLADFLAWGAYRRVKDFLDLNPDMSVRALMGYLLELRAELELRTEGDADA